MRLYTVEVNGNECNFKDIEKKIIFEKGKNYKIKYNYCKNDSDSYLFKKYGKISIIKETGFELNRFTLSKELEHYYYIINLKNFNKNDFYIYLSHETRTYLKLIFANESAKDSFTENFSYFNCKLVV